VDVQTLGQESDLLSVCRNSIRGTSKCIAGAVFHSSPSEGPGGMWNYSLRADAALQTKIVTDSDRNDAEIYLLPLQHAIDRAISGLGNGTEIPETVEEYPYTSLTKEQRKDRIRTRYMGGIIDILAVAFFIGVVGVTYQLTGIIATEREIGMAQLLDCMMPNVRRWQPQMARIIGNHLAFDLLYAPGWIVMAIILSGGVFTRTSAGIVVIFNILAGLSMSSMSILGAAFFKKAQLSGITSVIISLLLAIIAQVAAKSGTASVAILSLLFPPMNYVYFTIFMARWERQNLPTNLVQAAPKNTSALPGIVLWIFLIIQIIVFPILGAWVERYLYGTASKERHTAVTDSNVAVKIESFTKQYPPSLATSAWGRVRRKPAANVMAVNNLTLEAMRGQIMVLLGANGSGKSTTLDAIAGLNSISSGSIQVNYSEEGTGLGFCPQKNVLWDNLTVEEHVRIFNKLKANKVASKDEIRALLKSCDISKKSSARSKTLSGGQKRKVQLAMMFIGGSTVCCIDEVSSGLDPLSRRKIWDILLAERGRRTFIFTTHFLDEADLLADDIKILSKGSLKASGTSVALKHNLGSGYRVHVYHTHGGHQATIYKDVSHTDLDDQTTYLLPTSSATASFLTRLENDGVHEYQVSGPTIEDVFLKVAEEVRTPNTTSENLQEVGSRESADEKADTTPDVKAAKDSKVLIREASTDVPKLLNGRRLTIPQQVWVLFGKRWTILRRNPLPYAAALLIPIIAAGLVTLFLSNFERAGCSLEANAGQFDVDSLSTQLDYQLVAGPSSSFTAEAVQRYVETFGSGSGGLALNTSRLVNSVHLVDTLTEFNRYIDTRFANVTPGGFFLGGDSSPATFAWRGDESIVYSVITMNAMDNFLANTSIASQYQPFDVPWAPDTGDALQLITYFGLAMSVYPSFFALYPTIERLRQVRGLHYSNGVRPGPLWGAYTLFDFMIVVLTSAIAIIIFRAVTDVWYHIEYLFVVFFLYGLTSTLLSYVISLISRSQLAAFAFAAGGQAVMFLLYFIAFMSVLTYSPPELVNQNLNIAHFSIAAISPVANLTRALFVALNVFSVTCRNREFASYAGSMTTFGGPILYLILQSFILFGILLWWDSGAFVRRFLAKRKLLQVEELDTTETEVSNELTRVTSSRDGLRLLRVSKEFKKNLAVNDVSFGVPKGEVFALLGPNGAGKSTCISMIRGDLQPSQKGGDILVEDISVLKHRAQARALLGVCPQFDAMDKMTAYEHLYFYAKARGVSDPKHNVQAVMKAVGLTQYADRMAEALSGGNKRKLSLGIALSGNPSVLLLDEPSSGMDAASKRVMWKTLASVVPGRSLVLTTHSMEEADALATRAGILSSKMLALGTTDYLRRKHGDAYYVHVVHEHAPHSSSAEMQRISEWIVWRFPDADVEDNVYGGQVRFTLPIQTEKGKSSIAELFNSLEEKKEELNIAYYSVSRSTLDQVFLAVCRKASVLEEGEAHGEKEKSKRKWLNFRKSRQ
jgi:ATP-binding cassette, subfamily A (ABC1), member 3